MDEETKGDIALLATFGFVFIGPIMLIGLVNSCQDHLKEMKKIEMGYPPTTTVTSSSTSHVFVETQQADK